MEKFDCDERADEREDLGLPFPPSVGSNAAADRDWESRDWEDRYPRGMFEGLRRERGVRGMLAVVGAGLDSPFLVIRKFKRMQAVLPLRAKTIGGGFLQGAYRS